MSSRQSSISARTSSAPSHSSQGPSSTTAKLLEKKKEYDAVSALEKSTALYLHRITTLGDDCEIMAKAGEVHGHVLEQWPRMFQILSLFLAEREKQENNDISEGQRLVRLPIDELQRQTSEQS